MSDISELLYNGKNFICNNYKDLLTYSTGFSCFMYGAMCTDTQLREQYRILNYGADTFLVVPNLLSGVIGQQIKLLGKRIKSEFIQKAGNYFPEISTFLCSAYVILGELGLDIFPHYPHVNTPDLKDIPIGVITAIVTYYIGRGLARR